MKVFWDDHERWEVTVARSDELIHVYLSLPTPPTKPGKAPAFPVTCEVHKIGGRSPLYVKPAKLEKALGLAQKECDRKNMAEHVANERVKLLAINEQNWVEAPSRLDVPVRDGGKSI